MPYCSCFFSSGQRAVGEPQEPTGWKVRCIHYVHTFKLEVTISILHFDWHGLLLSYSHVIFAPRLLTTWAMKTPGVCISGCYAMESSPNGSFALLLGLLGVFSAPLHDICTLNLNSSIHNTQSLQNVCWASWCLLTYCSAEAQSQKKRGWFHLFSSLKAEGVKETARLKQWLGKI